MSLLTYHKITHSDQKTREELSFIYQMPDVKRFLHIGEHYFDYVTNTENVFFYQVEKGGTAIGTLHIEIGEDTISLAILVFPAFQSRGWGTRIITDIKNDVFGFGCKRIEAYVDPQNKKAVHLFHKSEFSVTTQEDMLLFVYSKS